MLVGVLLNQGVHVKGEGDGTLPSTLTEIPWMEETYSGLTVTQVLEVDITQ